MCWLLKLFGIGKEKSPSDWLPREAITAVDANLVVDLSKLIPNLSEPPKVWIPPVPSTGSMLPNFSHEHNNILIAGANEADHAKLIRHLEEGDIAVYRVMQNEQDDPADYSKPNAINGYAIHRIIGMGIDGEGKIVYTFRGDNNPVSDPHKVREKNLLWISIGTIF